MIDCQHLHDSFLVDEKSHMIGISRVIELLGLLVNYNFEATSQWKNMFLLKIVCHTSKNGSIRFHHSKKLLSHITIMSFCLSQRIFTEIPNNIFLILLTFRGELLPRCSKNYRECVKNRNIQKKHVDSLVFSWISYWYYFTMK